MGRHQLPQGRSTYLLSCLRFAFAGKRGAGGEEEGEGARESRKLKEKKEKKFNSQLSKINSIIKKRKEGGDDGSVAGGIKLFDGSSKRSKI